MLPIAIHPVASEEASEAADWYEEQQPGLGARFESDFLATIQRILDNPKLFAAEAYGERFAMLDDFPYAVIFKLYPDKIWVSSVSHHKRRTGHWRSRKPE